MVGFVTDMLVAGVSKADGKPALRRGMTRAAAARRTKILAARRRRDDNARMTAEEVMAIDEIAKKLQGQIVDLKASHFALLDIITEIAVSPAAAAIVATHKERQAAYLKKWLLNLGDVTPGLAEEFGKQFPNIDPAAP